MILIIPDIHGRNFWRKAVLENIDKVEYIIFLGDYVDPYNEEYENFENMEEDLVKELKDIIQLKKDYPKKVILLLGNHDCHYIWEDFTESSRYNIILYYQYNKLFKENLNLFNFAFIYNKYIFTHAGITENWGSEICTYLLKNDEFDLLKVAQFLASLKPSEITTKQIASLSLISFYRGGWGSIGSCEWADIREHLGKNQEPIEYSLFQVFGHTQLKDKLITSSWACLDCRKAFLLNEDKFLEC